MSFAGGRSKASKFARKKTKPKPKVKKRDPIYIDGVRPRPMYVDYKDLELLSKLVNRQGKIIGRRKVAAPPPASMRSPPPSSEPGSWHCFRTWPTDVLVVAL